MMFRKLSLTWHVIMGRPLIYGCHFIEGDGIINLKGARRLSIESCTFGEPFTTTKTAVVIQEDK